MNSGPIVPELPAAALPEGAYLLDVREDEEWAAGHAPDAVHIPLGELGGRAGAGSARPGGVRDLPGRLALRVRGAGPRCGWLERGQRGRWHARLGVRGTADGQRIRCAALRGVARSFPVCIERRRCVRHTEEVSTAATAPRGTVAGGGCAPLLTEPITAEQAAALSRLLKALASRPGRGRRRRSRLRRGRRRSGHRLRAGWRCVPSRYFAGALARAASSPTISPAAGPARPGLTPNLAGTRSGHG